METEIAQQFLHLLHRTMLTVTRDEIALEDEPAIASIISLFGLKSRQQVAAEQLQTQPPKTEEPQTIVDAGDPLVQEVSDKFESWHEANRRLSIRRLEASDSIRPNPWLPPDGPLPFWRSYFLHGSVYRKWHDKSAIWIRVDQDINALRRVVISGLKNEQEANDLWREYNIRQNHDDTIEDVAARITSDTERHHRAYQRNFRRHLSYTHRYFTWQDGEAIESAGHILPISQSGLNAGDVELLRQVFMRLPPMDKKLSLGDARRSEPIKDLKTAREKVKQHAGEFADAGFAAWVDECLQTKTDKWTRSRDPLYLNYKAWIKGGGHGLNRGQEAEAKATALSEQKWGRAMRRRFPDAWNQDNRSILYRVSLKRGQ